MNGYYLIALPAWVILFITACARLADMDRTQWALTDHVRRLGMMGVGAMSIIMVLGPFTRDGWLYPSHTWRTCGLSWSWALVWVTTPGMPPWWDFILGVHRKTDQWRNQGLRARMRGEAQALRDSFTPRRKRKPMAGPQGPLP